MVFFIIYLVGFIVSIVGIYKADRILSPDADRNPLDFSILVSLLSWIKVAFILWYFMKESRWYKTLEKRWEK